ncbi:hypothetical protein KTT66_12040 [Lacticaseibacillus casei]|jgi:hypothetical protein|uniref:Uncharacterized protein n=1 Tax=Lacticaseibacillus huelsenbergensis TaxID=3035291 RepID=A0ABY8DRR6_9LACO|nr:MULTISPECIES: hypothetical protein [Lacticaseibacillus]MDG3063104.1 hypothetical protein [Lacticaseibacillus sp. BCRC 81376]QVI37089.1 hypothetical protein KGS74_12865 [Lacticaseibacillus casei]QXG58882.1 hypothetical protein KTT66_12040 [Lacticaseibacillus casei]WFB39675.1 hypothetical protein LHUE1_000411 [Lacticaseibacillus huelsenbergensis]WFB41376.1 hypothetical protein LHUE2_002191 [Lacticaseibacillus huelsenbergensis]
MIEVLAVSLKRGLSGVPFVDTLSARKTVWFWGMINLAGLAASIIILREILISGVLLDDIKKIMMVWSGFTLNVPEVLGIIVAVNALIYYQDLKSLCLMSLNQPIIRFGVRSGISSSLLKAAFCIRAIISITRIPFLLFLITLTIENLRGVRWLSCSLFLATLGIALITFMHFSLEKWLRNELIKNGLVLIFAFVFTASVGKSLCVEFIRIFLNEKILTVASFFSFEPEYVLFLVLILIVFFGLYKYRKPISLRWSYMKDPVKNAISLAIKDTGQIGTWFYFISGSGLALLMSSLDERYSLLVVFITIYYSTMVLYQTIINNLPGYFEINVHKQIFIWNNHLEVLVRRCLCSFLVYLTVKLMPLVFLILLFSWIKGLSFLEVGLQILGTLSISYLMAVVYQLTGLLGYTRNHDTNAFEIREQLRVKSFRTIIEGISLAFVAPCSALPLTLLVVDRINIQLFIILETAMTLTATLSVLVLLTVVSLCIKRGRYGQSGSGKER